MSQVQKVEIVVAGDEIELCDISVETDPTFWVSKDGTSWTLTHNSGAPDIDVDVGDRDAVLEVLRKEFGYNNVVPISNVNTFKVKTLIKDIAKFHGIPFEEANAATRTVEQEVRKATQKHGDDKNLFVLTFDDAMKYSPSFIAFVEKYPEVADSINVLFKEQRSLGRHAGGVVIMDDAPSMMPLIANKGEPQTPWTEGVAGKGLEPLGYIKYDLLGLETMRLIARTIELILQRREGIAKPTFDDVKKWYDANLHPDANDYDDPQVYEYVYEKGNFAGIFQLTSTGAQRLFKAAKPKSVVDIAVLTSIYRPGPLAANVDKIYLRARKGEKFDWGHPLFEKVLGQTDNCLAGDSKILLDSGIFTIKELFERSLGDDPNTTPVGQTLPTFNEDKNDLEQDELVAIVCNGEREILEIETENGQTLKLTADHRIMTRRGWVTAGELTAEDEIMQIADYTDLSGLPFLKDDKVV